MPQSQALKARQAATVILGLFGLAQAGVATQDAEAYQLRLAEQRDAINEVPAHMLKNMVLTLLQDEDKADEADSPGSAAS